MKLALRIFILITCVITLLMNNYGLIDAALLITATFSTLAYFERYPFMGNLCKYMVLFTLWIPVVMMPAYHLVYHILGHVQFNMTQVDYDRLLSFGSKVYILTILSCFFFSKYSKKKRGSEKNYYTPKPIPEILVYVFFVLLFCLSVFCYITGLGRMGAEPVVLPFHLGGIINLFRKVAAPILFAILAENYILRGKKMPRNFFVLYGLWSLFEVFVWMSKSIFLSNLEPILLVYYLYYRPSFKTIVKYMMPIVLLVLFLYPIIGIMRYDQGGNKSMVESFNQARSESVAESKESEVNPLILPLNRAFMAAYQYAQDYSYLDQENLFDFSRFVPLLIMRGSAVYQTRVLDGYPEDANHSSGTSGLLDPLLHGGYGLCYILVVLMVLFASCVDKILPQKKYTIFTVLFFVVWEFTGFKNISMLYDFTGVQAIIVKIIVIYLAYKINFKRNIMEKSMIKN